MGKSKKPVRPSRKLLPRIIGVAVVALVGIGFIVMIQGFLDSEPPKAKKPVQQVTLLPPPPPPPPKQEPPPPEPEVEQEEVEVPEPEAMEEMPEALDEPPPLGDQLGLDAEGGAGSDGFGLAARKGGRGLLSGGDPNKAYASRVVRQIEDLLLESEDFRRLHYSVVAHVWLASDGSISRVELRTSTGHDRTDAMLIAAIEDMVPVPGTPPPTMPNPIRFRIKSQL